MLNKRSPVNTYSIDLRSIRRRQAPRSAAFLAGTQTQIDKFNQLRLELPILKFGNAPD